MEKTLSKVFGLRAVIEAIQSGKTVEKAFVQKGLSGNLYSEFNKLAKEKNIAISFVPVEKLDRLSKNQNHQGIVVQISPIEYYEAEILIDEICSNKEKPLFLILDHLTDVRNYGSIIRTAECTGVDAIIVPKSGSASLNADAIKTSAGAAFKVPICKVNHIKDAVFLMQSYDVQVVAATEKTEDTIYDVNFNTASAIIMGAEDRGVNPSVLKVVNNKAKLPLLGEIGSLNVSVACGAFLYEVVRQRTK
ncbi:23S rRNA (guanosine(2251)-2'-O)-methyltransferase RlmB [Aureivirga marina]|uniref:23S rRNA (guanosine(2251)-2'-O)-methyltransferase RlmB n=1 Tax=Aureivirga marina TaxID=1182451 RepID=UPI0018C91D9B|nr:23S rRNA (guanosine(2251)-2'-O)-methyltransferase RlmB [Aureivirga marina]